VAITGIAGPDGGTPEKPVGTVWYATHLDGETRALKQVHFGERDEIRARAAQMALYLLWRRLIS
jgi:nicotinamide-nucleotide amidase